MSQDIISPPDSVRLKTQPFVPQIRSSQFLQPQKSEISQNQTNSSDIPIISEDQKHTEIASEYKPKKSRKRSRDQPIKIVFPANSVTMTGKSESVDRYINSESRRPRRASAVVGCLLNQRRMERFEAFGKAIDSSAYSELLAAQSMVPTDSISGEHLAKRRKIFERISDELKLSSNSAVEDEDAVLDTFDGTQEESEQKGLSEKKAKRPAPKAKVTASKKSASKKASAKPKKESETKDTPKGSKSPAESAQPKTVSKKSAAQSKIVSRKPSNGVSDASLKDKPSLFDDLAGTTDFLTTCCTDQTHFLDPYSDVPKPKNQLQIGAKQPVKTANSDNVYQITRAPGTLPISASVREMY